MFNDPFVESVNIMAAKVHQTSKDHGFWEGKQNFGEKIALIHSELSEALEAHRMGRVAGADPDKHCPEFSAVEVELADAIIRILDLSAGMGLSVAAAVVAKAKFNDSRPMKHGKSY